MISDDTKKALVDFIEFSKSRPKGYECLQISGPKQMIDTMLTSKRKPSLSDTFYEELVSKRKECEQVLAGLLGML